MGTEQQTETTVMHRASVVGRCLNPKNSKEFGCPNRQLKTEKRCSISSTTKISSKTRKSQNASKISKFLLITAPDYKMNGDTIKERKKLQKPSEGCSFHIAVDLWRDLGRDRTGLGSSWGSFRDDHGSFRRDLDDCRHLAAFG